MPRTLDYKEEYQVISKEALGRLYEVMRYSYTLGVDKATTIVYGPKVRNATEIDSWFSSDLERAIRAANIGEQYMETEAQKVALTPPPIIINKDKI